LERASQPFGLDLQNVRITQPRGALGVEWIGCADVFVLVLLAIGANAVTAFAEEANVPPERTASLVVNLKAQEAAFIAALAREL
jgi:hypothetical protein